MIFLLWWILRSSVEVKKRNVFSPPFFPCVLRVFFGEFFVNIFNAKSNRFIWKRRFADHFDMCAGWNRFQIGRIRSFFDQIIEKSLNLFSSKHFRAFYSLCIIERVWSLFQYYGITLLLAILFSLFNRFFPSLFHSMCGFQCEFACIRSILSIPSLLKSKKDWCDDWEPW